MGANERLADANDGTSLSRVYFLYSGRSFLTLTGNSGIVGAQMDYKCAAEQTTTPAHLC